MRHASTRTRTSLVRSVFSLSTLSTLAATCVIGFVSAPVHAQDERPEGWLLRADRTGADLSDVYFVDMPPGYHFTTGPAVIAWQPQMTAGGQFRVEMEVYLFDPGSRREAFGFFVGGQDLEGAGQRYLYFLIREGGQFLVKTREGRNTNTLVEWTAHPAIRSFSELEEGSSSQLNVLAVEAHDSDLRFLVNGEEVTRVDRSSLQVEGTVGIRVNHALNLHVSRFEVGPLSGESAGAQLP